MCMDYTLILIILMAILPNLIVIICLYSRFTNKTNKRIASMESMMREWKYSNEKIINFKKR